MLCPAIINMIKQTEKTASTVPLFLGHPDKRNMYILINMNYLPKYHSYST